MPNQRNHIMQSLELHLFFARIMKEHSLFLEAGFTPANAAFSKKADLFKLQFESLLSDVVELSQGAVRPQVINSEEIVTPFTLNAERQTEQFTGISINTKITVMESQIYGADNQEPDTVSPIQISSINRRAIRLLNGLIEFKELILRNVESCQMFTMNYPLLIEHIIREAKLYRSYVTAVENGTLTDEFMKDTERFWNQIMMEHAMFIRGLLDPSEAELINTSNQFAQDYAKLLEQARTRNDMISTGLSEASLEETKKFKDLKQAGTIGIQKCEIKSVILPLLADHVLREANHYIRLLQTRN